MRLSEIYIKEFYLKEFWKQVSEDLLSEVDGSGLNELLSRADEIIFKKFNINPKDKVYFISGSARLYLYPKLRDAFGLNGTIGDLDIVIPYKELWIKAGLVDELKSGGIYRPTQDGSIEAFTIWDPSRAGGKYANVSVRSTNQILADADFINGHYFMSMFDVADYKTKLNREKELDVVNLINQYNNTNFEDKHAFLRKIISTIGLNDARNFLSGIRT
jgi:hypothetical protein